MINNEKHVPAVVIKRLPRYYRYLSELLSSGVNRISSGELSSLMNVTASQIRQDFNYFGGFGQQGYGYNVEYLHKTIGEILGLDKGNSAIVIGVGNLGRAIANHDQFEKRGFKIAALFDIDENICYISLELDKTASVSVDVGRVITRLFKNDKQICI